MKKIIFSVLISATTLSLYAQKESYISLAVYNTQTALPFGKFAGHFSGILHPGVEMGAGKILSRKSKHEWFADVKLSYFYHRYVQHGIPLYADIGYRYKIFKNISAETLAGIGYMHSIPATGKFKLNDDGNYINNKGAGRMQATASFSVGLNYSLPVKNGTAPKLFTHYQQRLQMPFVRSYVPLLPYNSIMIGITRPLDSKRKK
jgi:hypothetical protein